MFLDKIPVGKRPPELVNVVVEVPLRSDPIKYEFNKDYGALVVDRFLYTMMFYPCNYGFIPHTMEDDGDPLDIMVVGRIPVTPGAIISARPIGLLELRDESGNDKKILAVPDSHLTRLYENIRNYSDIAEIELQRIQHFFGHYKDLEPDKWVEVGMWHDADHAKAHIVDSIEPGHREELAESAGVKTF